MSTYKNTITLRGFLGKDAEQRTIANQTPVTVLSLATESSYKDKPSGECISRTDWHRIVAFGRLAESARTLTKGAYVEVEGVPQSHEYTSKADNQKRRAWEVRANSITKLGRAPRQAAEGLGVQPEEDEVAA